MSLELDPVELGFRRPFNQEVEEKLRLRNNNSDPVAFKVKTTAPKQYCVRPNSGRIEPGQTVEVSVLLQAMKDEPPMDAKCRDKFLVQSVAVSANDEFTSVAAVWTNIEQTSKSSIQEKKIRVNFLPASGSYTGGAAAVTPSRSSTAAASDDMPPAYGSPLSSTSTPAAVSSYDTKEKSRNIDSAATTNGTGASGVVAATGAAITSGAAAVANAVPTSTEDLKAQLAAAQNQIAQLTRQAQDGLRQRKSAAVSGSSTSSGSSSMALQQPPNGVPVPVVAGLCLLSFLLAYLLF